MTHTRFQVAPATGYDESLNAGTPPSPFARLSRQDCSFVNGEPEEARSRPTCVSWTALWEKMTPKPHGERLYLRARWIRGPLDPLPWTLSSGLAIPTQLYCLAHALWPHTAVMIRFEVILLAVVAYGGGGGGGVVSLSGQAALPGAETCKTPQSLSPLCSRPRQWLPLSPG
jgi:hypothetical protein